MRIFPGWREAGAAMRWARRQDGVQHTVRQFPLPGNPRGYTVHSWLAEAADMSVTIGHDSTDADFTARNSDARRDEIGMSAAETLDYLAQLGIVPLSVAEAVTS
ncbi:hypothetical protein [Actinoplanes missouriensis]|nr:hypothetical protein [Actinoplanes missouriensis]